MTPGTRPALHVVGTSPDDPVVRQRRFEATHPDITITPPETHASLWTARQAGKILVSDYQLGALLGTLDWLLGEQP